MLQLRNVALRRGTRLLFDAASLQIHPGQKVGVAGANGTGKSSLFALLRGELHADSGDVEVPADWQIASVAQELANSEQSAVEFAIDGDTELRELQHSLGKLEVEDGDGVAIAHLHSQIESVDGYAARSRACRLLHGLGFSTEDLDRPVNTFSGGWRMRLNLAQALMCRSDLLLLDGKNVEVISANWIDSKEVYKYKHHVTNLIDQHNLQRIIIRSGYPGKTTRTIQYFIRGSGDITVTYDSIKGGKASKKIKLH